MKKIYILAPILILISLIIWSQFNDPMKIIHNDIQVSNILTRNDYYSKKIQPIFDARCIACHSCYNSPCQLNLTSYEGVIRGANKVSIYDFPKLSDRDPTRLYIDAATEVEWRKKDFYPIINTKDPDDSVLNYMLSLPNGIESGQQKEYISEESRVCMSFISALQKKTYEIENPAGRMPYGLPEIENEKVQTLKHWQSIGAPGPDLKALEKEYRDHQIVKDQIIEWEKYFNRKGIQSELSSRYIYEHLFLAHIYFEEYPNLFFRLVRSKSLEGDIEELGTSYPFDHPGEKFSYRLRPITNTITHKNHIPYEFSKQKMKKWNRNFYQSKWSNIPKTMPEYGRAGANPYKTFASIPARSRYQFFLDDTAYHIMTFIKGPVCRGQVALNVINDHFWVFFVSPEKDITVSNEKVYNEVANTISFPAQIKDDFKPSIDFRKSYWKSLHYKFNAMEKSDFIIDDSMFWDGDSKDNTNAAITVYRHFDSSTILRGLRGQMPKTAWVLDYQVFESIYYNLTASYNVFAPLLHQINSRLFMEISRIASEDLFISALPKAVRMEVRKSWNRPVPKEQQSISKQVIDFLDDNVEEKMSYEYSYPGKTIQSNIITENNNAKEELFKYLIKNKFSETQLNNKNDNKLSNLLQFKAETISHLPDTLLLRLKDGSGKDQMYTIIHNKDHYNISMLFFENDRRNRKNDSIDVLPGLATSYANYFLVLNKKQLEQFSQKMKSALTKNQTDSVLREFGITRNHKDFWEHYEWFSKNNYDVISNESGYLDLNRYINL